jgi:hypothetical protein
MSTNDDQNGSAWQPTDNWATPASGDGGEPTPAQPPATSQPSYFGDQPENGGWGMAPLGVQSSGTLVVGAGPTRPKWVAPLLIGLIVTVILASLGGFVLWKKLAAHGGQPELMVPANAIAYAEVDLDPSAGQKLKVRDQLRKIPALKDKIAADATDLKQTLFDAILTDVPIVDYNTDIKPWLGSRAAVAVLPGQDTTPEMIFVVQHTDKAKAETQMRKLFASVLKAKAGSATDLTGGSAFQLGSGLGQSAAPKAFAVTDEYIVMGPSQTAVDDAVASAKTASLAGARDYQADLAAIGSDQIITAWADMDAAMKLAASTGGTSGDQMKSLLGDGHLGRYIAGLHATDFGFELSGRYTGGTTPYDVSMTPRPADWLKSLPRDTAAAVYLANPGEFVTKLYTSLKKSLPASMVDSMDKEAAKLGIKLPTDVADTLGSDLVASMSPIGNGSQPPGVGVRVHPKDADAAIALVEKVSAKLPDPSLVKGLHKSGADIEWSTTDAYGKAFDSGKGDLASSEHFKKAMKLDGDVEYAVFVDSSIAPMSNTPGGAIGVTITKSGDATVFTLRLVID